MTGTKSTWQPDERTIQWVIDELKWEIKRMDSRGPGATQDDVVEWLDRVKVDKEPPREVTVAAMRNRWGKTFEEVHRWDDIARYNAEVHRGIVHTEEWKARMAYLQAWFDAEQEDRYRAEGYVAIAGGGWVKIEKAP